MRYKPDIYYINPESYYIVMSGQDIDQCSRLPYVYPFDLLDSILVHKYYNIQKSAK